MKETKFAVHIHNSMFSMTLINPLAKIVKLDDIDYKLINNKESIQYTIIYTLFDNKSNFIACYRLNSIKVLDIKCDLRIIINSNSINYPELTFIKYLEHVTKHPANTISIINKNNFTTFPLKDEKVNLETAYTYLISGKINYDSILYKYISNTYNINLQLISIEKIQEYLRFYILKNNMKYFNINKKYICELYINTSYEFTNPFKNKYCIVKILKDVFNYNIPSYNNKPITLSRNETLQLKDKYLIINLENKYSEEISNKIKQIIIKYLNNNVDDNLSFQNSKVYLEYRLDEYMFIFGKNIIFSYKYINTTHYYFYDINIRKINLIKKTFEHTRDIKQCKKWVNPYIRYNNDINELIIHNNNSYIVCTDNNNISFNCTDIEKSNIEHIKLEELYCLEIKVNCTKKHKIDKEIFCNDLEYKHKTIYNKENKYIKIALGLTKLYIYTNLKFEEKFNFKKYNFIQVYKISDITYYRCTNCNIQDINILENEINKLVN
jgi:hypothetical protein